MKYIDADKLIAEIERRQEQLRICCGDRVFSGKEKRDMIVAYEELDRLRSIINSLQQEQPILPGYNQALLEVKSKVDELYEETSIGLCEYDSGLYNGITETCMKLRGFIKARLDSEEQPDVDLEKEIERIIKNEEKFMKFQVKHQLIRYVARHFYELGLNARKEENK